MEPFLCKKRCEDPHSRIIWFGALVALVYWMVNNLMDNGENYKKILSNALYAVIVIAIITGLIYAGMNVLLR